MDSEAKPPRFSESRIVAAAAQSVDAAGNTKTKCARRDKAWHGFYDAYREMLVRFCIGLGRSPEEAEDVFQQIVMDFLRASKSFRYDGTSQRFFEKGSSESAVSEDIVAPEKSDAQPAAQTGPLDRAMKPPSPGPLETERRETQRARSARFQRQFRDQIRAMIQAKMAHQPSETAPHPVASAEVSLPSPPATHEKKASHFGMLLFGMAKEYARFIRRRRDREVPIDSSATADDSEEKAIEFPSDEPAADKIAVERENQANLQEIYAEAMGRLRAAAKTPAQVRDVVIFEAVGPLRPFRKKSEGAMEATENNVREELMKVHGLTREALDIAVFRMKSKMRSIVEALLAGDFQHLNVEELFQ